MKTILRGKYDNADDAAIKFNALLVVGELNDPEEGGKGKPSAAASALLVQLIKSPDGKAVKDYMKAAALVGLERHAAVPGAIPDKTRTELTDALIKLLEQKEPPAGRDEAAHQYLRRSAGPDPGAAWAVPGRATASPRRWKLRLRTPRLRRRFVAKWPNSWARSNSRSRPRPRCSDWRSA